jgi:valyl-tRNA synthetase
MTLLHPYMPFVIEEIWHQLRERQPGDDCVVSAWPQAGATQDRFLQQVELAKQAVSNIRDVRNKYGLKMKEPLAVYLQPGEQADALLQLAGLPAMIRKMANLTSLETSPAEDLDNPISFLAGTQKFFVILDQAIDVEEERQKLNKELERYRGFVASVEKKLNNERFVQNAPAPVVEKERKKLADGQSKIKNLEEALAQLG